jgi:hypothetical protein
VRGPIAPNRLLTEKVAREGARTKLRLEWDRQRVFNVSSSSLKSAPCRKPFSIQKVEAGSRPRPPCTAPRPVSSGGTIARARAQHPHAEPRATREQGSNRVYILLGVTASSPGTRSCAGRGRAPTCRANRSASTRDLKVASRRRGGTEACDARRTGPRRCRSSGLSSRAALVERPLRGSMTWSRVCGSASPSHTPAAAACPG